MNATGSFKGQQAPCGRIVDGETYQDQDDEVVVTQETILHLRMPEHPAPVSRRRRSAGGSCGTTATCWSTSSSQPSSRGRDPFS